MIDARKSLRTGLCALAALVLVSAAAQQAVDHWTLEAMAAQARTVFRGTIMDVSRLELDTDPGKPARVRISLTVAVEEKFKGSPDRWMTLDRETLASDNRYDLWMKAKTQMLWFAFSEEDPRAYPGSTIGPGIETQPGRSWTAVHLTEPEKAELTLDKYAGQGSFSIDLKALSAGKDKTEATTKFLKVNPSKAGVFRFWVPTSVTSAIGRTEGTQHIVVPVTSELEAIALKMVNSPGDFLPKEHASTDETWIRSSGIRALGNFKSDKSTELLKGLLNDSGKGPSDATETPVKTLYWVRLAAYDVLTDWGVKVQKPALSN